MKKSFVTEEEFQKAWNESYFVNEVVEKLGYKNIFTASNRASDLRKRGYYLKNMAKNHADICPLCGGNKK